MLLMSLLAWMIFLGISADDSAYLRVTWHSFSNLTMQVLNALHQLELPLQQQGLRCRD